MSIYNPYIAIPFLTWVIAQLAKFVIAAFRSNNKFDLRYLYASGGMPSAHSAVVCSLAVTALLRGGVTSPIFGLSAVLAAIVMYDSFGVRRAAGEQAAAINAILDTMTKQRLGFDHPQQRLREILGHKPLEVTVGALSGIALSLVMNASFLTSQINWLTAFPSHFEVILYLVKSAAFVVLGVAVYWWLARRYQGSKAIKGLAKQILALGLSIGLVGLILDFAGYQKALYLGWRLWIYLLLFAALIWIIILVGVYGKTLPQALAAESETKRIRHWLPGKKRKRR